jgi:hypothetical protein
MTSPNDQFAEIANRSQEAVTAAVHTWTDAVQSFAGQLGAGQSQLPDLSSVVDQYFDFAEKVLANQREFAQQWASAAANASGAATEQAQQATRSVAQDTTNGAEAVAENTAETARVAGDETASNLGAARNAAKG